MIVGNIAFRLYTANAPVDLLDNGWPEHLQSRSHVGYGFATQTDN